MNIPEKSINISLRSIIYLILLPLTLFFVWTIRDIIFSLLIGFILMSALRPAVARLVALKIPRAVAVIAVYLLFVCALLLLFSLILPPIVNETMSLVSNLPTIFRGLSPYIISILGTQNVTSYVPGVTNNVVSIISSIFSNALFVVTTLFFGVYLLLDEELLNKMISNYFESSTAARIVKVLKNAELRMSSWFWGEITLMTLVGLFTFVGLNIIGVRYALPLAVLAGLLEIVPNIGPTLSAIPAVFIGMTMSYFIGIVTLALYIIVQQLENSLIVPIIMKKAVGINPVMTLLSLMVGGRIGGVLGLLLAIPLFLFIETITTELIYHKKNTDKIRE